MGKSTLVEAIAIQAGFNPEGGSRNFNFETMQSHSTLFEDLKITRTPWRNKDGYFLRAESFYNVASEVSRLYGDSGYYLERAYGQSLHHCSHGEVLWHYCIIDFGVKGYIFWMNQSPLFPYRAR